MTTLLLAPRSTRRLVDATMVGGSAMAAWSAAIHLHLWLLGYRHIATIGPLFLAQGAAGVAIAAVAVAVRRGITALAGAIYLAATSVGLLLSATVGLFNFHDRLDAPYAGLSLTVQLVGIALFAIGVLASARNGRDPQRRVRHQSGGLAASPPDIA